MDGYSCRRELIFDDGDSCNVEGSTLLFRLGIGSGIKYDL